MNASPNPHPDSEDFPYVTRYICEEERGSEKPLYGYALRTKKRVLENQKARWIRGLTKEQVLRFAEKNAPSHLISGPTDVINELNQRLAEAEEKRRTFPANQGEKQPGKGERR